jgi:hypothetical protein
MLVLWKNDHLTLTQGAEKTLALEAQSPVVSDNFSPIRPSQGLSRQKMLLKQIVAIPAIPQSL